MLCILLLMVVAVLARARFTRMGRAERHKLHHVTMFVKGNAAELAKLPEYLAQVSDPRSASYGRHWTFEDMNRFANKTHFDHLVKKLQNRGVHDDEMTLAPNYNHIAMTLPVHKIEKVFGVKLHRYRSKIDNTFVTVRPAMTYDDASILSHVDWIAGLDEPRYVRWRGAPKWRNVTTSSSTSATTKRQSGACTGTITPACVQQAYSIGNSFVQASVSQGVSSIPAPFLSNDFSPRDLSTYQSQFSVGASDTFSVVSVNGGVNTPSHCDNSRSSAEQHCGEADLDTQMLSSTARGAANYFVVLGGNTNQDYQVALLEYLQSHNPVPNVFSISYGAPEIDIDPVTSSTFDNVAMQLGLQGVTIVVASGDAGVGDGNGCDYSPSYPATSAYVTSVGATQGAELALTEIVASVATGALVTSGGGFSVRNAQPSYQTEAVATYIAHTSLPAVSGNTSNRAFPDVAVAGSNVASIVHGSLAIVDGTSASAPMFAGMVSLVNAQRVAAGLPTLGFLNPALYQMGSAYFNDIVSGSNSCGEGPNSCCDASQYGFNAAPGYDPVTGWGSPRFEAFSSYLSTLAGAPTPAPTPKPTPAPTQHKNKKKKHHHHR